MYAPFSLPVREWSSVRAVFTLYAPIPYLSLILDCQALIFIFVLAADNGTCSRVYPRLYKEGLVYSAVAELNTYQNSPTYLG